jgi:hypothetical protein
MFKDYYQILDIRSDSTIEEIKSAFKKQALRWHPDRNIGKDTTQIMQDINEAYLILKDFEARAIYNEEYLRFNEFKKSTQIIVGDELIKSNKGYSNAEKEYEVHDEVLYRWMENARQQAINLAKETLEDLLGMTKAGLKDAGKNILFLIISTPIIFIILAVVFSIPKCDSIDKPIVIDSLEIAISYHKHLDIYRNIFHVIPDTSFQINDRQILFFQQEIYDNQSEENKFYLTILRLSEGKWTVDSRWIESDIGKEVDSVKFISLNNKRYFYYESYDSGGSLGNFCLAFVMVDILTREKYSIVYDELPSIITKVTINKSLNLKNKSDIESFLEKRLSMSNRVKEQTQSEKIAQKFLDENAISIDTLLQTTMNFVYFNQVRTRNEIFKLSEISSLSSTIVENNDFLVFSIFKGCLWCFDKRSDEFICLWVPQSIYSWVEEIEFSNAGNLTIKDTGNNKFSINIYQSVYMRYP